MVWAAIIVAAAQMATQENIEIVPQIYEMPLLYFGGEMIEAKWY